jgi:hypothetical protein
MHYWPKADRLRQLRSAAYPLSLFLIALAIHLSISAIGWRNSLTDAHGFRQTQTAITTYYILKEGFRPDYITPVLGAPWSIPLEFPLFQGLVGLAVKTTAIPLDQAGRLISVLFFYASLYLITKILGKFLFSLQSRLVILSFILLSPLYLFWSRTFMIESLALFLSLLFFYTVILYANKFLFLYLLFATVSGSLAALSKITTFTVVAFPALLTYVHLSLKKGNIIETSRHFLVKGIYSILLFGIPLAIGKIWVNYADHIKNQNPLAVDFLTSQSLVTWTFGSFQQKLSFSTWQELLSTTSTRVIGWSGLLLAVLFFAVLNANYRWITLVCIFTYFLGPLVFTNLYYTHDYYFYANAVFLLVSTGLISVWLMEHTRYRFATKIIIIPGFIILLLTTYKNSYYPLQTYYDQSITRLGDVIREVTSEEDVLLIYGNDWNPEIPYYAERKSLMNKWNYPLTDPRIQKSIENIGRDRITAMITRDNSSDFTYDKISYFSFYDQPVFQNRYGTLYIKRRHKSLGELRKDIESRLGLLDIEGVHASHE